VTNSLIFDGTSTDIWILQIAGTFDAASGANITLTGGAQAKNIFWAIAGATTIITTAHVEGIFLLKTNMAFQEGSSLNGCALAQTAVTLIGTTIGFGSVSSASRLPIDLKTAGNYAILSKSGISTTSVTSVTGDIGVSPIAATGITGFSLVADSSNTFSTSHLVTGKLYAADYASPTPPILTAAVSDMEAA